ncbi:uncharacterized protein METZ01_LOCUS215421, partial [marine metagenome]
MALKTELEYAYNQGKVFADIEQQSVARIPPS